MSFDAHSLQAVSTVAVAPSPATSGTTLTVQSGDGTEFVGPMNLVVCPPGVAPTRANSEVIRMATNPSGDVLTFARAQETSSARSIQVGDQIFNAITPKVFTDIETAVADVITGVIQARATDPASPVDGTMWFIVVDEGGGVESVTLKKRTSGVTKSLPLGDLS